MLIPFNGLKLTVSNICNAVLEMHDYNISRAKSIPLKTRGLYLGGPWKYKSKLNLGIFFSWLLLFLMVTSKFAEASETASSAFAHQCLETPSSVLPCPLRDSHIPLVLWVNSWRGSVSFGQRALYKHRISITRGESGGWNTYRKVVRLVRAFVRFWLWALGLSMVFVHNPPKMTLPWDVSEKLVVITRTFQSGVMQAICWLHAMYQLFCMYISLYLFH